MAWIESHTVTGRHRKLIGMASDLRIKKVYLLGHLHALWHSALEQQEDGDLSKWTDEMIALYSEFEADCHQYVSLLHQHRWLDDNGLLHDWLDYAGRYLIRKYATSNPAKLREIWAKHGRVYGSAALVTLERPESDPTTTTPTIPTIPNQPNHVSPVPPAATGPDGKPIEFPIVGEKGGGVWTLPAAKLEEYRESFPGVDVMALVLHARQWCRDNQRKRKTSKGMPQFLSGWIARNQNRGGHRGATSTLDPTVEAAIDGMFQESK